MLRLTVLTALAGALLLAGCADPCDQGPGTICTVAGTGKASFDGDGKDALESSFYWPIKVRFDPQGRLVVMDWNNHRVRRLEADGTLKTVIGNENIGDGPDGATDLEPPGVDGTLVNLNHPTDVIFRADGSALLASWHNHKLREWDPGTNRVHVLCGRGAGFAGDDGPVAEARLDQPRSLAIDAAGNIYLADQRNQRVRRIRAQDGVIETIAGTGVKGFGGDDGPATAAQLSFPAGTNPQPGGAVAVTDGVLFIADTENHRVRALDLATGNIRTVAGTGEPGFSGDDGPAAQAQLKFPRDVAVGPDGHLYVADTENHAVRRVELPAGTITTVAGDGSKGSEGDGEAAAQAKLFRPHGLTFDGEGNLFIADTFNNRVRRVAAWGK